jgi:hypothetical protein
MLSDNSLSHGPNLLKYKYIVGLFSPRSKLTTSFNELYTSSLFSVCSFQTWFNPIITSHFQFSNCLSYSTTHPPSHNLACHSFTHLIFLSKSKLFTIRMYLCLYKTLIADKFANFEQHGWCNFIQFKNQQPYSKKQTKSTLIGCVIIVFPLVQMGVLAPGSAHTQPSAWPMYTLGP